MRKAVVTFDVDSPAGPPPRGAVRPFLLVLDDGERLRIVRIGGGKKEG
jgi:hypothetical protein